MGDGFLRETTWKIRKKFKDFEINVYNSLFFKDKGNKYIVIGDLHLGFENALRLRGISIPRRQMAMIKKSFNDLGKLYGFDTTLVFNGDIKHEFSELTYEEKKEIDVLFSYALERFEDVIVIKGNHDNFVVSVLEKKGIEMRDYFETSLFHIEHGHRNMREVHNKNIVISHEHPALKLRDDVGGSVKIDCFLVFKYSSFYIVVLPSFSSYSEGIDILRVSKQDIRNTLIKKYDINNFEVYGIDAEGKEILYFGKVGSIKKVIMEGL